MHQVTPPSTGSRTATTPTRRTTLTFALALGGAAGLASCSGGDSAEQASAPTNEIAVGTTPDYYPAEYSQIVEASKGEGGALTIYSNTDQENWAPIFRDFRKKYDWVTAINANNLDSDEVFQRALSEQATGGSPADILVSNAAQAWAEYTSTPGRVLEYASPEVGKLPEFATLIPNVYALSVDPMTIAYNTALLEDPPTGIAGLGELVAADPDTFRDKITTRDIGGAFGFTVSYTFTQADPAAWSSLEKILPLARPETSSGTQTEKIVAGEYLVGFFISAAPAYPVQANSDGLFDLTFPDDGAVVLPRGIGIAPQAPHANTAKLFLDFVLSTEGQRAAAEGGLTSYRDDVQQVDGLHTYAELVSKVGQDKVVLVPYTLVAEADVDAFTERWNGLLDS